MQNKAQHNQVRNQNTFHGHSYLPLDILSLRKAKADRRDLREYKRAQKSNHQQ